MSTSCTWRWRGAAVALSAILALAACSPSPTRPAQSLGYEAPRSAALHGDKLAQVVDGLPELSPQRHALKDGIVTSQELDLAWRQLRSCLETAGFAVSEPVLNPITQTDYLYTYRREHTTTPSPSTSPGPSPSHAAADATDDEAVHACEDAYWTPLSLVYSANTPQHMDRALARSMVDCMTRAHYMTSRATTFDDLVRNVAGQIERGRLQRANTCLDESMPKLFPDLPYFPRP